MRLIPKLAILFVKIATRTPPTRDSDQLALEQTQKNICTCCRFPPAFDSGFGIMGRRQRPPKFDLPVNCPRLAAACQ